ncbi:hypothetical protein DZB54_10210 [Herbaspirillum sp. 3R-3a1]|nr:hypothetical protein DZB54_10210 [Herbaspirillum sp. 3R-3a1]
MRCRSWESIINAFATGLSLISVTGKKYRKAKGCKEIKPEIISPKRLQSALHMGPADFLIKKWKHPLHSKIILL